MPTTDDLRLNPDHLLARLTADQAKATRGKLKIFFGACPGVGKTYGMLSEARRLRDTGLDVVIGLVETHGRRDTAALIAGLECLPMQDIPYQGKTLHELDLQAALRRRPAVLLVDELAHSNAPGAQHPKRWQDVEELLAAGIDVYSTVNVQHLESLNDIVSGITGITVRETIPDHVFDEADDVVLVDLPPDDLLQRLKAGQVYLPEQAERAAANFFRKGNLLALRELALRRTADRVDDAMRAYRQRHVGAEVWRADESLLVCIGPQPGMEALVRSSARLAAQLNARWHAIYLETPEFERLADGGKQAIHKVLHLAETLGAETATPSANSTEEGVIRYARLHNLSRVVLGRRRNGPGRFWRRGLADRIAAAAPDLDIVWISRGKSDDDLASKRNAPLAGEKPEPRQLLLALLIPVASTLLALPVYHRFDIANIVMLFLIGVVAGALYLGRTAASLIAVLNVIAFDFFFVQPRFSFAVTDVQYLFMFLVMLVVGLVIGQLTARLRYQAQLAGLREQRATALYEMARELSSVLTNEGVANIAVRHVMRALQARSAVYVLDMNDELVQVVPDENPEASLRAADEAIARWVLDHGEAAGWGTNTLPATPQLYVPLRAPMRTRGVLVIASDRLEELGVPEQQRLLDTFAALMAIALERVHFVTVAQDTLVKIESERLRNTLLAALSHDLRTPLTTIVGLSERLGFQLAQLAPELKEQADTLGSQARGMVRLVHNLLDMARLESGELRLRPDWYSLQELVGSTLKLLGAHLDRHHLSLDVPADLPLVWCDGILIERVLVNLLENAAKYGQAPIEVNAQATDQALVLTVRDHGPGLPAALKGREHELFEKFTRGVAESAKTGVGLGLAICQAIVDAHRGHITAGNAAGGGAEFTVSLPRRPPPQALAEMA